MAASPLLQGETGDWEVVLGLEVHAQVASNAKLFSAAATAFGAEPNAQVSLVDAAMPGMLPVINARCVEQAVRTGLALGAEINLVSVFDRKNYFYPDLPPGYQISQYTRPIVGRGEIMIDLADGGTRAVGITRLHLEQDAGKSLHDQHPTKTFVDLNRAGIALMEIVSEPDLRGAEEAGAYLRKLRSILRYVGTCNGNMEQGSLRCDANVSVRRPDDDLGTRCEIKNLNSVRFLIRAIEYEAARQIQIIEGGGAIAQETRLFDSERGETRTMRTKEEAHDYRYFPDPDLLPLELDRAWVGELRTNLPELPDAKKARFMAEYGLDATDAEVLVAEADRADYFEIAAEGRDPKLAANWVLSGLLGKLNKAGLGLEDAPVGADQLGGLLDLIVDGTISGRIAKDVFDTMFETGRDAAAIVEAEGLRQMSDSGEIAALIESVLEANADKVAEYRGGKRKLLGFFVGQVMQATQGKANPKLVNELLRGKLDS
ncbi:MAG: Asp-tRNA(Asn)/Glu-tRNA(Gln) amidotransferase subunit GatB [Alphaproteobacteria bacterium]|jgi:aspartyl-tRNA(Asn)/glutamyl-tRNA(Gln) amidotransferase subunit B|nr:Asp-tRNA(Asn)/Glu-tRNA(Gln) amidotransferase subunit GatB [Alphaproteobacteria bacterium]MDP6515723.1 Asp-tRNA(Asn)/Glu-tRNA(Gln) amidotransferase subunit GatB [Alphaproteobacteria bacterium]